MLVSCAWSLRCAGIIFVLLCAGSHAEYLLSSLTFDCAQDTVRLGSYLGLDGLYEASCDITPTLSPTTFEYYLTPTDKVRINPTLALPLESNVTLRKKEESTDSAVAIESGEWSEWLSLPTATKQWYILTISGADGSTIYSLSAGADYDKPYHSLAWMIGGAIVLRVFLGINQVRRWFSTKAKLGSWNPTSKGNL